MPTPFETRKSTRRLAQSGFALVAVLCGVVGGWAFATEISGAIIAEGTIVVDHNVKRVQHPHGGVVGEIRVRDGDRVRANDLLLRLDPTITRANLTIIVKGLNELTARRARLESERDGAEDVNFPDALHEAANADLEITNAITSERKVHKLRLAARIGQKSVLGQRIEQLREEIRGHIAQVGSKDQEIALINRELDGARKLWAKSLMPISKLTALEREAARLGGERGQLLAAIAQAKGRISEAELQILQIDLEASREVAKELREVEGRIGELVERRTAAEDQMGRIDIRAPLDGTIHQSVVHTVGGVIGAGETLMLVVPGTDRLTAEAKIVPREIDQVRAGQPATLRFSAFNRRTTPEINGTVSHVSADISTDERSRASHYIVRILISQDERERLGDVRIMPGMPVEVMIRSGERSVMSYLVKPLEDQIGRAFREQ